MRMMSYENDVCAAGCEVLAHQDEKLMQLASSLNSMSVVKFCFLFLAIVSCLAGKRRGKGCIVAAIGPLDCVMVVPPMGYSLAVASATHRGRAGEGERHAVGGEHAEQASRLLFSTVTECCS